MPALLQVLRERNGPTILVSEEVGLGVHAPTEVGRRFADVLGDLNQAVAEIADMVLLVVAGYLYFISNALVSINDNLATASAAVAAICRRSLIRM